MFLSQMVADGCPFVLFNALVKVPAGISDITCVAQVTLELVHNALLAYKGWLLFTDPDLFFDLFARVDRGNIRTDLTAKQIV